MWLKRIEADRLRNLKQVELELSERLTMVSGRNGEGKTSLLESAYVLATGRSFRTRKLDEMLSWSGGTMRLSGVVESRRGETRLAVLAERGERRLLVGTVESDLESYLGRLDVVDLTAARMQVLRGAPVERRRFLDRGVVGLRPAFLRTLGEYRRIVGQRNALLRTAAPGGGRALEAQLSAWDERLVETATAVHTARRDYAVDLAARLAEPARVLFGVGETLELCYQPSPAPREPARGADYRDSLREALQRGRSRDLNLGYTGDGPHRDDLLLELNNVDLRRFGSAGQVRAAMIVLKLAKLSRLREERGEAPLFLMDDFDTDLDEPRAGDLAGYLDRGGGQALVASSKERMTEQFGMPFAKIRMEGGVARA